ncbi:MAG: tetratricopeptide repeat protein [Tepidisphaerales bacterium]
MNRLTFQFVLALAAALAGCQQPVASNFTLQRGTQLLAAGSPKSAIPFLSQTIASTPDGPEPIAMLALAYALDLQGERAILQAREVHRPQGSPPGWELVAVGIAQMTLHRPADAVASLQRVVDQVPAESPISAAARQWLVLAQILKGDHAAADKSLQTLAQSSAMRPSATLWTALIDAYYGRAGQVTEDLTRCGKAVVSASGQQALTGSLVGADDQTMYDAAVAATAQGDLDTAQRLFAAVDKRSPEVCDASVWLALLAGTRPRDDAQTTRSLLKQACQAGSMQSRGLANQLFSVVCALEDRPDEMIQSMLAGQRMLARHASPQSVVEQPKPEPVWFSDNMK